MVESNEEMLPKKIGRKKLPEHERRIRIAPRIEPKTKQFLESLGEKNIGRAIDHVAKQLSERD